MSGMPSGDTPVKAQEYYHYLQAHQQTQGPVETWHVLWFSLGWMYWFLLALVIGFLLWVVQYRSTHRRAQLYPVDRWAGFTTESARPGATMFFVATTALWVGICIALVVGHIVWGQLF
jgi:hypothetical protein